MAVFYDANQKKYAEQPTACANASAKKALETEKLDLFQSHIATLMEHILSTKDASFYQDHYIRIHLYKGHVSVNEFCERLDVLLEYMVHFLE